MAVPLKPKPALIATVAAYHNYVPGKHFRSKQWQQLGSVKARWCYYRRAPSWETDTFFHGGDPGAQRSRLGIVTARLLGDHLGPEVSREPSLSGFNAPWALIITTYHIGHYCVVRTAKKMGPWLLTAASRYESSFDGVNIYLGTLFIWYKGDCGGGSVNCSGKEPAVRKSVFLNISGVDSDGSKSDPDSKRPWQGQIMGGVGAWQTAAD